MIGFRTFDKKTLKSLNDVKNYVNSINSKDTNAINSFNNQIPKIIIWIKENLRFEKLSSEIALIKEFSDFKKIINNYYSRISSKEQLKQYTDEELDKFVNFVKKDAVIDDDTKIADRIAELQTKLQEVKHKIKELRVKRKNPIIPELLTRNIGYKIAYYGLSKKDSEYTDLLNQLKYVESEIIHCSNEPEVRFIEEIKEEVYGKAKTDDD